MSKRFKSQDYFRYPRLRSKWRRPKGRQSKLRLKKGGSGMVVAIGYGTPNAQKYKVRGLHVVMVHSLADLAKATQGIIIASGVGAKKTKEIATKAKEMKLTVINQKKVKKALMVEKTIQKRKVQKKEEKAKKELEKKVDKEKKKEEKPAAGHDHGHDHAGHDHSHPPAKSS